MKRNFKLLAQSPERINVITTKLGADDTEQYSDLDIGKPMVMGKIGNMVIAAAGDEIEGFLDNVASGPTEDGHKVGGVARHMQGSRAKAVVEGAAEVLDLVVAGANTAHNTASATKHTGVVKKGTPSVHVWRIIAFENDAASTTGGDVAILEKL